jgi:hypothetical protein
MFVQTPLVTMSSILSEFFGSLEFLFFTIVFWKNHTLLSSGTPAVVKGNSVMHYNILFCMPDATFVWKAIKTILSVIIGQIIYFDTLFSCFLKVLSSEMDPAEIRPIR